MPNTPGTPFSPRPPRPSKIHFRLPISSSVTSPSLAPPTENTCYYTLQIYKCAHPLTPRTPPIMYHSESCPFPLPEVRTPSKSGEGANKSGGGNVSVNRRFICDALDSSPRIQMLNENCQSCADEIRKDTDVDGEWVLVWRGEGEGRVEKWMTVRIEGGCDWRGLAEKGEGEAVIRDGMGEEWVLFG